METPNILCDARWIRPQMTGVGQYTYSILKEIHKQGHKFAIILPRASTYIHEFKNFKVFYSKFDIIQHPFTELEEQFFFPLICYLHGYNKFLSFEGRVPFFHFRIQTYSVIYDLSFLRYKASQPLKYRLFLLFYYYVSIFSKAKIITISKTVKSQILTFTKINPNNIEVVYPAASDFNSLMVEPCPFKLPKKFLLLVGATNLRKNIKSFCSAFNRIIKAHNDLHLVITGNVKFIKNEINDNDLNVHNLGYIPQSQLKFLYQNAYALVFPSIDEGFGIPLVEASQFSLPIACSNIDVFKEIMNDKALYFDPFSVDSIAECIEKLVTNKINHDYKHILSNFTWNNSSTQLLEAVF